MKDPIQRARNYVYFILSKRSYTKKEISDKLKRRKYDPDDIKKILKEFEDEGFLNDKRYAYGFALDKKNFNSAGKRLVKMKLVQKGVDKDIIDSAVENAYKDTDEYKMALELAERKVRLYKGKDKQTIARRLQGFLIRRGYAFDVAMKVVKKLVKDIVVEE
jgi:regulatory protein